MNRIRKYFLQPAAILLPIAVTIASCAQQVDEGPGEAKLAAADVVACLVDSTPWEASSDGSVAVIEEVISAELGELDGKRTLILTAWNVKKGEANSISMYAEGIQIGDTAILDGKVGRATYTSKLPSASEPTFYRGPDIPHGSLTITAIDTLTKRITGSFSCQMSGITVENGRFDTKYSEALAF